MFSRSVSTSSAAMVNGPGLVRIGGNAVGATALMRIGCLTWVGVSNTENWRHPAATAANKTTRIAIFTVFIASYLYWFYRHPINDQSNLLAQLGQLLKQLLLFSTQVMRQLRLDFHQQVARLVGFTQARHALAPQSKHT